MDPREFQKIMNMAKSSDHPMSEGEFQEIFNTLKQGKSEEEVARMEQMVKLARSFMKLRTKMAGGKIFRQPFSDFLCRTPPIPWHYG